MTKTSDRKRIKYLEGCVATLEQRNKRLAKARKVPKAPACRRSAPYHIRVLIPDTHGCFANKAAIAALLSDMHAMSPQIKEVVMLGDHLDCGGFLAQHHTLGYVAEAGYTFEQDVEAANELLDAIQAVAPKATIDYIAGNHEDRLEKWCVTETLRNKVDAAFLLRHFSPESVLNLPKRNIPYYRRSVFYDGLSIPGTIKRGKCHFTHGSKTGIHAAKQHLDEFAACVVFGHTHRSDSYTGRTVDDGTIAAWNPGCLCDLQPMYMHTNHTRWSHGYGLQLVQKDGAFLHINVPIIGGKSHMMQLVEAKR